MGLPPLKFFPKDVISGEANKVGDIFEAQAFGYVYKFKVIEACEGCVMAELQEDEE